MEPPGNGSVRYDPKSDLIIINRYGVEYTIPPECLTGNRGTQYQFGDYIASGITGSIWALNDGKFVIRITPLENAVPGPDCYLDSTPEDECPRVSEALSYNEELCSSTQDRACA